MARLVIGERLAKRLEALAWVGIAGFVLSILAVVALHFLRPDVDPATRTLSEFAIGPYGYLEIIADFGLGFGSLALALGIWWGVTPSRAISAGSLLLGVSAISWFVGGVFPTDLQGSPVTTAGAVHGTAALISVVTIVGSIFLSSRGFRRDPAWGSYHATFLALGFAAPAALLILLVSFAAGLQGVGQRVLLAVLLLWLLSTGVGLRSAARASVRAETSARAVA